MPLPTVFRLTTRRRLALLPWLAAVVCCASGVGTAHADSQPGASAVSNSGSAEQARAKDASVVRLTLQQCLTRASRSYPSVAEAKARIAQVEARLREVRTAPFSDFSTTAGLALAPTLRGTQVYSPDTDVSLSENMGFAWQVDVSGTLPLWTFGKIANATDAATAGVQVKQHELRKAKNELNLSVRRAYYGVQFAREGLGMLLDAQKEMDKHLDKLQEAVDRQEGDEISLFKMKMYRAELEARESEVRREEAVALSGLRLLVGGEQAWDVLDESMPEPKRALAPLGHYLAAARIHRPEINMARAGVLAREAQLRLEKARFLPDVGLKINAGWSQAPEVTNQINPFSHDPANYLRYGAALGLRWKLDFLPQRARYAQARAQLEEMRATEQMALGGVGVEVERAYLEAKDSAQRLASFAEAAQWARRWLISVQQGIDIGTYEDEDIVQPAKEYALRRFSELSATYDYHVALGRLALATGWESVAPVH